MKFTHLHVHSQYSILDGAADIPGMFAKAVRDSMPGIALTDHGNMFGAFKFVAEAEKYNIVGQDATIKPIVGCEFYVVEDRTRKQFTREQRDQRYHQLLLAKTPEGYQNLVKLCSLGFMEGMYSKYPRIDKELILKYHKGLIATTCCLAAEVPRAILRKGEEEGEKVFKWWLELFGDDYYVELQRHGIEDQNTVNRVLVKFARKYNVKMIATNDSHYVEQDFFNAHDILLCVNTGEKKSTPTFKEYSDEDSAVKGTRFAFENDQFYFKTTAEMTELFADIPEAIDNTNEIVGKVELLNLRRDILLPQFAIPTGFPDQFAYLQHLTMQGARKRYGAITPKIQERIDFELGVVRKMDFTGYFLIVSDFIKAGRELGVYIGPGRGSAAGSVVAYCIGITNIDPLKYDLLFERFLNPDRVGMPDIDTDFDDEGRQKVINYVVEKYGHNQVAQVATFGTMAARSSIKDVARVLDLPLNDSNMLAKLVPERPGIKLARVMNAPFDGKDSLIKEEKLSNDQLDDVRRLRAFAGNDDLKSEVIREALKLEGGVRNTGIHAAALIIAPRDLTEIIPVFTSKETDLLITQFEGSEIEGAGVIKMDFLGLKTLTIIRDAIKLIENNRGVKIDIENVPLDDKKTLELYQKGETNGTFQFESPGMQKYLRELKPDKFEDLIAMNALYRPGPMEYIGKFIARKFGREKIEYDLPEMQDVLEETYGVTVYQEQVMRLSQMLAGFTKGEADNLRKIISKKKKDQLAKQKAKFIDGCVNNKIDTKIAEKIFRDWEAFAEYAFNKSHSTCYAFVAFQTAYLKAHYPAEYMASVLTHNLSDQKKITFFIEETRKMNIPVLGPDINESQYHFSVNKKEEIRFGLGAVKGVGENAVAAIIDERNDNGGYTNIFDFTRRINLRTVNRRNIEALVMAGAFDTFGDMHRAQLFYKDMGDVTTFLDKVLRNSADFQAQQASIQVSLFGGESEVQLPDIPLPECPEWGHFERLKNEKEVTGFYISGHPLDEYDREINSFCNIDITGLKELVLPRMANRPLIFAGLVSSVNHRISRNNVPFASFVVEDFNDSIELSIFSEDYLRFKHYLEEGMSVIIRASMQQRFRGSDIYDMKFHQVNLLAQSIDFYTTSLHLSISIYDIDRSFIQKINQAITESKGAVPLTILLHDSDVSAKIKGLSNLMVDPRKLVDKLNGDPLVEIKLNSKN